MIISCPACSARYRIDKSKIKGNGAKVTCPRCRHKFVVYKQKPTPSFTDIAERDFKTVGVSWIVRKGLGVTHTFHTLNTLKEYLENGTVDRYDSITYDNRTWIPIHSVDNLEGFFTEIWKKAERGEMRLDARESTSDEEVDDDCDAPTKIIRDRDQLLEQFRHALEGTPSPAGPRTESAGAAIRSGGKRDRPSYLEEDTLRDDTVEDHLPEVEVGAGVSSEVVPIPPEKPPAPKPPPAEQSKGLPPIAYLGGLIVVSAALVLFVVFVLPSIQNQKPVNPGPETSESAPKTPPAPKEGALQAPMDVAGSVDNNGVEESADSVDSTEADPTSTPSESTGGETVDPKAAEPQTPPPTGDAIPLEEPDAKPSTPAQDPDPKEPDEAPAPSSTKEKEPETPQKPPTGDLLTPSDPNSSPPPTGDELLAPGDEP